MSKSLSIRREYDGQGTNALRPVDQYALDVGSRRRPGHEYPVPDIEPRTLAISVMQVLQDACRVEQYDQMLRQESQGVDLELRLGNP